MLADLQLHVFDDECAKTFGRIQADLLAKGITVPVMDLLIAVTAIVHDLTLVTHNLGDFQNIPGLRVVDWLEP